LQRPHGAPSVADVDIPQRSGIAPVLGLALQIDLPRTAVQIEVVYKITAQRRLQRREHIIDVQSERLCFLAIDVEKERRSVGSIGREYAREARIPIGRSDQSLHYTCHGGRIGTFKIFELEFEPSAGRQTYDGRQIEWENDGGA